MKRFVAAVAFAVLAAPVFGQPQSLGRTDPMGPAWIYDFKTPDRTALASSGATRSDTEIGTDAAAEASFVSRHVERRAGYFDPSQ